METLKKPSVLENQDFNLWLRDLESKLTLIAMGAGAYLDIDLTVTQLAALKHVSDTSIRSQMKVARYSRAFRMSGGTKGNMVTTIRKIREAEDDICNGILD